MDDNNLARPPSFSQLLRLIPALFLVGAAVFQIPNAAGGCVVCQSVGGTIQGFSSDSRVELARARERADSTQKQYETARKLSERGSVSQHVLRRSDLQRKVALLDYSSLLHPNRREKNLLLKADVILRFRVQELAVAEELYQRGSVSRVDYLRTVAAKKIAEAHYKAAKSRNEAERKIQVIKAANSKFELAQNEYEIAKRLFRTQSISQFDWDRAVSNLKVAEAELQSSKESLGARASRAKQ